MTALALSPAARPEAYASVSYSAWRIGETDSFGEPYCQSVPVGEPETLKDALAAALVKGCLQHKDHLAIRETGVRLRRWANGAEEVPFDRLHLYAIRRKSRPRYEWHGHIQRRVFDLYAEVVCVMPGECFAPQSRPDRPQDERGE